MREALSEAAEMIQPGISLIGQDYFIKVNDRYMHLKCQFCLRSLLLIVFLLCP